MLEDSGDYKHEGMKTPETSAEADYKKLTQDAAFRRLSDGSFVEDFAEASLSKHLSGTEKALKLAALQKQYVEALLTIAGGTDFSNFKDNPDELYDWDQKIYGALFDKDNTRSLVSAGVDESDMVGAINALTLMQLWQNSALMEKGVKVSMAVAKPNVDVNSKIDIIIETSDSLYLLQLKASKGGEINAVQIKDRKPALNGKINSDAAGRMLDYAKQRQKHLVDRNVNKEVKVFAIELPGMGSYEIGNVFGKVRDKNVEAQWSERLASQIKNEEDNAAQVA